MFSGWPLLGLKNFALQKMRRSREDMFNRLIYTEIAILLWNSTIIREECSASKEYRLEVQPADLAICLPLIELYSFFIVSWPKDDASTDFGLKSFERSVIWKAAALAIASLFVIVLIHFHVLHFGVLVKPISEMQSRSNFTWCHWRLSLEYSVAFLWVVFASWAFYLFCFLLHNLDLVI